MTASRVAPADYAEALERLHAGMRRLDVPDAALHRPGRGGAAARGDRDRTPELAEADRELLGDTLRSLRRAIGDRGSRAAAARRAAPGQRAQHRERAAVHRPRDVLPRTPSSTSPTRPRKSASTIRVSIRTCCASAASSCWRWSPRGAGTGTTSSRTDAAGRGVARPDSDGTRSQLAEDSRLIANVKRSHSMVLLDASPSPIKYAPRQRSACGTGLHVRPANFLTQDSRVSNRCPAMMQSSVINMERA